MLDTIESKKTGQPLTRNQIDAWVKGVTAGNIPDYQSAALLMAIRLNGMTAEETLFLTEAMTHSGDRLSFPNYPKVADKHSTGGVGDKVTLVLAPLVAACGAPMAMLSGRGLGFSGGTIDKFESLEGVSCERSLDDMRQMLDRFGWANTQATKSVAPADRILYRLRDVTATVDSIPLITASIMSKKIAGGATHLVLDVKCGSGAFMSSYQEAKALAESLKAVGEKGGLNIRGVISKMDEPLGHAVGNYLELMESVQYLQREHKTPLMELIYELGALNLQQFELAADRDQAITMLREALVSGEGLRRLNAYLSFCGAPDAAISKLAEVSYGDFERKPIEAQQSGFIQSIEGRKVGFLLVDMGAGRHKVDDQIDPMAGLRFEKHVGDHVEKGEVLAYAYGQRSASMYQQISERLNRAVSFSAEPIALSSPIHDVF